MLHKKFNQLKVISMSNRVHKSKTYWICECDCGNFTEVEGWGLRSGHTKTCGHLINEILLKRITKHGCSETKEYKIYTAMKQRCYNQNHPEYKNYGERGIQISDEWLNGTENLDGFSCFLRDVGKMPDGRYSIDRIDNNGHFTNYLLKNN